MSPKRKTAGSTSKTTNAANLLGAAYPLGATLTAGGVNFSVYADKALALELLLFDHVDDAHPAQVIRLDAPAERRDTSSILAFDPGTFLARRGVFVLANRGKITMNPLRSGTDPFARKGLA